MDITRFEGIKDTALRNGVLSFAIQVDIWDYIALLLDDLVPLGNALTR